MTPEERRNKLYAVMKTAKGEPKAITKEEIYVEVWGTIKTSEQEIWYNWQKTKQDLRWLRKNTNCYPISKRQGETRIYYVPTSKTQITPYLNILHQNAKGCKRAAAKILNYVETRKYNLM